MAQRNRLVFELGLRRRRRDGSYSTRTLAVHPMVTAPESWVTADRSRSFRQQTTGSSQITRGGRGLRDFRFQGTFGSEIRGVGAFIGTGEQRRLMFEREVVRLPDAAVREDLDEVLRAPIATPGLKVALSTVNLDTDTFFLNVYDFWFNRSYEGLIRNFEQTRDRRSASGATWYQLTVEEIGPIVHEGIATEVLGGLQQGIAAVQEVTDVFGAFNLGSIAESVAGGVTSVAFAGLEEMLGAVKAQAAGVAAVVKGVGAPIPGLFASTSTLVTQANEVMVAMRPTPQEQAAQGVPSWSGDKTASAYEDEGRLHDLEQAARQLPYLGGYVGLSDADWQTLLSGEGRRETRGDRSYVVAATDDMVGLERKLGIDIAAILAVNDLLPDEALVPGTRLDIPQPEQRVVPDPIAGLPTLDSHAGQAAWGSDLRADFGSGADGINIISGDEVIVQGLDLLVFAFGEQVIDGLDRVPPEDQAAYLSDRLAAILVSDPRVAAVADIALTVATPAVEYQATVVALNGTTVTTGGV